MTDFDRGKVIAQSVLPETPDDWDGSYLQAWRAGHLRGWQEAAKAWLIPQNRKATQ